MRVPEKKEVVGGVRGSQIEKVFIGRMFNQRLQILSTRGRLTPPPFPLPHHQLVIMKAGSLIRRRVINAKTDR